jgi:hypothetical protein
MQAATRIGWRLVKLFDLPGEDFNFLAATGPLNARQANRGASGTPIIGRNRPWA